MTSCQDIDIFSSIEKAISHQSRKFVFQNWTKTPLKKKTVHLVCGFRRCRYKYLISHDGAVRAPQLNIDKDVCMIKPFKNFMLFEPLLFLGILTNHPWVMGDGNVNRAMTSNEIRKII